MNWLNPEMVLTNKMVAAFILIGAELFQFTPFKGRCLKYCQTAVAFIHQHWKEGKTGASKMGIKNGLYCVCCCWILMVVLFVSGIMNLLWIALIALFVLLEKLFAGAKWISLIAGAGLVAYGTVMLFSR